MLFHRLVDRHCLAVLFVGVVFGDERVVHELAELAQLRDAQNHGEAVALEFLGFRGVQHHLPEVGLDRRLRLEQLFGVDVVVHEENGTEVRICFLVVADAAAQLVGQYRDILAVLFEGSSAGHARSASTDNQCFVMDCHRSSNVCP